MKTIVSFFRNRAMRFIPGECSAILRLTGVFVFLLIFCGVLSAQTVFDIEDSSSTGIDSIATNQNPFAFVDTASSLDGILSSGAVWTSVNPYPQGNTLLTVDIFRDTGCIAAGYLGSVISTTNRGGSWQTSTGIGGATEGLFAVNVVDSLYIYMAGTRGVIMKSTDGGGTWAKLSSGTSFLLYDIKFVDRNTGWVVGSNGYIAKTSNGGVTWSRQLTPSTGNFYSIDFTSPTKGWVVGDSGTIYTTNAALCKGYDP